MEEWIVKKRVNIILGVSIVIIFFLGATFIPEYYIKFKENKYINKITLISQEPNNNKISYDIPIEDKLNIISTKYNENLTPILVIQDEKYLKENDKNLLPNLNEQIKELIKISTIPNILSYNYEEELKEAKLYGLSDITNSNNAVSIWSINFSDNSTYDFTFDIDAKDYKIYNMKICCKEINEMLYKFKEQNDSLNYGKETIKYDNFINGYLKYMEGKDIYVDDMKSEDEFYLGNIYIFYDKYKVDINIDIQKRIFNKQEFYEFSLNVLNENNENLENIY